MMYGKYTPYKLSVKLYVCFPISVIYVNIFNFEQEYENENETDLLLINDTEKVFESVTSPDMVFSKPGFLVKVFIGTNVLDLVNSLEHENIFDLEKLFVCVKWLENENAFEFEKQMLWE